jgi:pyrroline-5-carboxylate reductase
MAGAILLVGCGKMGGALLQGWLARGVKASDVRVIEPYPAAAAEAAKLGVSVPGLDADFKPEVIVLAVKPQTMDQATQPLAHLAAPGTVVLSIAAGKTIAGFEARFGAGAAIVRAMPNTPAAVGRGITVACANGRTGAAQRSRCQDLLSAVGEVAWVDDEAQMDAVTAVSGSGPAYVFLLIECLAEAAVAAGLAPDLAMRLARATVCGSGELAYRANESAAQLRQNVTSPGGTTKAALDVLMAPDGLAPLMTKAVAAAARRSRELAG